MCLSCSALLSYVVNDKTVKMHSVQIGYIHSNVRSKEIVYVIKFDLEKLFHLKNSKITPDKIIHRIETSIRNLTI